MLRIKKRDANVEEFDITKIENAIEKAFMAEHKFYNHDNLAIFESQATLIEKLLTKQLALKMFKTPLKSCSSKRVMSMSLVLI